MKKKITSIFIWIPHQFIIIPEMKCQRYCANLLENNCLIAFIMKQIIVLTNIVQSRDLLSSPVFADSERNLICI